MQLHIAVDRLPEDLPAKPSLNHVLQVMKQVVEEGRTALQQLRSSDTNGALDIEKAFSRMRQEFDVEKQIGFRVIVEGRPRPVHPIIRDEVYRIGREGLVNALRNSRSERIEVRVEYRSRQLRISIRDDGCDIDQQVSVEESWISGMRERAQRIGARLRVRRHAGIADEIELSVPGDVAFQNQSSKNLLGWLARWNPRNARL
jgi:signal transduction histidine kinase